MDFTQKTNEINIGNSYFEIKSSFVVRMKDVFTIQTKEGDLILEVDIIADMVKVPEEYREIFMNMLSSKYINKVTFTSNPFCRQQINKPILWWKKIFSRWSKS